MENPKVDQVSFFSTEETANSKSNINVVFANYICNDSVEGLSLFAGYDELRAITYSSSISFMSSVIDVVRNAEIIFGSPKVMSNELKNIVAFQEETIVSVSRKKPYSRFVEHINDNSLSLYVSKNLKSHEKLYLLKACDGRTRVIVGSANMSGAAFEGRQREGIIVFDNDLQAFEYYDMMFTQFKMECSNSIDRKLLEAVHVNKEYFDENALEVPYIRECRARGFVESDSLTSEEVEFIAHAENRNEKISKHFKKQKKDSTIKYVRNDLEIYAKERTETTKQEKIKNNPVLHIDFDNQKVFFNQKELSLNPAPEEVRADCKYIIEFLEGFRSFDGRVDDALNQYYSYMNWFFASAFIPYLRNIARKHGYSLNYFPVFGIMCGNSNAGKTTFNSLLAKLMTGEKITASTSDIFSYRELEKVRPYCEGVPIMIEDLAKGQYENNYEKIIKDDDYGFIDGLDNYPAVAITANKIQSLTPDITKRVVYIRPDISTSKENGAKNHKTVNNCINKVSSSLFCEYSKRMFPRIIEMANAMFSGDQEYYPDILFVSSQILADIFEEYYKHSPSYVRVLDFSDYFGDAVIGKTARAKIISAYKNQPNAFRIKRKDNILLYTVPDNSAYEIGYLVNELPSNLRAQKLGPSLQMNLKEAERFFDIKFKRGLLG